MRKFSQPEIQVLLALQGKGVLPIKNGRYGASHTRAIQALTERKIIQYNGCNSISFDLFSQDAQKQLLKQTVDKSAFYNISLYDDALNGLFEYSHYGYIMLYCDDDPGHEFWELSISSTSLSELEGSETGIIREYGYISLYEAENDIALLKKYLTSHFDLI